MKKTISGWQIVVVDNGFVFVGDCHPQNPRLLLIDGASQIRKWGTERGLGQLVKGPTPNTILDPVGALLVPFARVVFSIPASESHWRK